VLNSQKGQREDKERVELAESCVENAIKGVEVDFSVTSMPNKLQLTLTDRK